MEETAMIGWNITTLIGVYIFICLSLILYHIAYAVFDWLMSKKQRFDTDNYARQMYFQLMQLYLGGEIDELHAAMMQRNLKKNQYLIAFHDACIRFKKEPLLNTYLYKMIPMSKELSIEYLKHNEMEQAYFCWVIADLYEDINKETLRLAKMLLPYLDGSTIYCRENTLSALYRLGDIMGIEAAFSIISEQREFHHGKLISDGLLKFQGNHEELARRLWQHYDDWKPEMMAAIIDYIRYVSPNFGDEFYPVLKDSSSNLEVRLAILRYYRKYVHLGAYPVILECAKGTYEIECCIVACTTLDIYQSLETKTVLKKALSSSNWYVRKNAAASLLKMANQIDIEEILQGNDPYAKDMLFYTMQEKDGGI